MNVGMKKSMIALAMASTMARSSELTKRKPKEKDSTGFDSALQFTVKILKGFLVWKRQMRLRHSFNEKLKIAKCLESRICSPICGFHGEYSYANRFSEVCRQSR